MSAIREEEARKQFEQSLRFSQRDVDLAKPFLMERIAEEPRNGANRIREWWAALKAPPLEHLVLHEEYDYPDQCARAARHWAARLGAARALTELVREGYLDSTSGEQTERVS